MTSFLPEIIALVVIVLPLAIVYFVISGGPR
jgi:hypothetical protein